MGTYQSTVLLYAQILLVCLDSVNMSRFFSYTYIILGMNIYMRKLCHNILIYILYFMGYVSAIYYIQF